MDFFCKSRIAGVLCLFTLLFHTSISFCNVTEPAYSNSESKSDTCGLVTVTGVVVDENGTAIPNVGVAIAGTYRNSRLTQSDGSFEIKVPANQKFYLHFQHISYLLKSIPINSESDIKGLKIVLKEEICHLDFIKGIMTCPPDEFKRDLPFPVFKVPEEELSEMLVILSKAEMIGGSFSYLPRFERQKSEILNELGSLGKELQGEYKGIFIVDADGVVRKVAIEGVHNFKVDEVLVKIFQRMGKWLPAKNYRGAVSTKFSFCVEFP